MGQKSHPLSAAFTLVALATAMPAGASEPLRVDLGAPGHPPTRAGAGLNWGVTRTLPDDATLAQLRPLMVRQPAALDGEHGDLGALDVLPRARAAGAHHLQAELCELLPGYPPSWLGLDPWRRLVAAFAGLKTDAAADDAWYEPWSEPDRNAPAAWDRMGGFPAFWKLTFDQLREVDPGAVVVGPGWSHWSREGFQDTLRWMLASDALPDVLSWSDLDSPAEIESHVAECRALLAALGIEERPIALTQYASPKEDLTPAVLVRHLASIERARVAYAALASAGGDLGATSRLLAGNAPRGAYWAWRWYVALEGELSVAASSGLDVVAIVAVERTAMRARIVAAGDAPSLRLAGLPRVVGPAAGDVAHVRVEAVPGVEGPVPAPLVVLDEDRSAPQGELVLDLPQDGTGAVLITLTPARSGVPSRKSLQHSRTGYTARKLG